MELFRMSNFINFTSNGSLVGKCKYPFKVVFVFNKAFSKKVSSVIHITFISNNLKSVLKTTHKNITNRKLSRYLKKTKKFFSEK